MRPPTLMSVTNEAEVQFVSRRKPDAAYHHNHRISDAPAASATADAADSTATVGFKAHYSFLSGLTMFYYAPTSVRGEIMK